MSVIVSNFRVLLFDVCNGIFNIHSVSSPCMTCPACHTGICEMTTVVQGRVVVCFYELVGVYKNKKLINLPIACQQTALNSSGHLRYVARILLDPLHNFRCIKLMFEVCLLCLDPKNVLISKEIAALSECLNPQYSLNFQI